MPGRNSAVDFSETIYKLQEQEKEVCTISIASLGDEPVTIVVTTVRSIAPRVNRIVTTIVSGSSPRLAKSMLSSIASQTSVVAW